MRAPTRSLPFPFRLKTLQRPAFPWTRQLFRLDTFLAYFQKFPAIQQCDAKDSGGVLLQKCYKLLIAHYFLPEMYNKNMISILPVSL